MLAQRANPPKDETRQCALDVAQLKISINYQLLLSFICEQANIP
jgi:hypothetical protein